MRHAACVLLGASLAGMAFAAVLDVAGALSAQGAGPGRVPLRGLQALVPPGATFLGPAPSTTALPLVVTLQPRNPTALAAEVRAVSDPASPEYRHFLTPTDFARRFGPTPGTIARVASVLRNEGLMVGAPSATGLSLPVSGTVAQVQSAFSTPIARYRLASGKTGYDNRAAPQVPVSVAPQIEGVLGLDTLSPPRPTTTVPQATPLSPHAVSPAASPALAPGQPSPQPGSCATAISTVQSGTGALDADELAQAYSFDPLYSSNHFGAGTTVALLELAGAGYLQSDINSFAGCYGITLGGGQITQVDMNGGGATGAATAESELDIETVLSLAPKADLEVYEGGASDNMYSIFSRIVSDDTAKVVSVSWTNGCEAYVDQAFQSSENTILEAAATEGQSFFVAAGDQGSQGCNLNGEITAPTGSGPVAQAVDPSTGTLYIANKSDGTLNVDGEGGTNASNAVQASKPFTGVSPDAVAVDASVGKVFVANAGSNTLTVFSTSTCNKTTTTGCGSPTQIASGGHLGTPTSLATNGTTLYVGNANGTVAVYSAATNAWKATVTLPSLSVASALAVDTTNGFVYVADSSNGRIEYFNATNCNATTFSGCSTTPSTVSVGNDPVGLAVAASAGDLYVANAGSGGGISVVSLSTHAVVKTISTSQPSNGTGLVQSIGLSPDGHEVLAALTGLGFPGDVMATVNTSTQTISATVNLETGTDALGQLVSDPTLGYTWVTDQTGDADVVQNLNLAVSDPASQPYVTAVGGTSFGHLTPTIGPPPGESVWNDQLYYSEGAGGGGISKTFAMPSYQQPLGTVSGSSGTPCANAGGDCREIPDVSADADPSSGYIVYDSVDGFGGWNALGGTSGAAPLWAGVLAVAASANGNTAGYGAVNPALYLLAQKSPGTYFNDVTSGNNDYNATNGGSFTAMSGYDMATGLGTPITSQLATGLAAIPLSVAVSGTQTYGASPTFTASANYGGSGGMPFGVTLNAAGLTCTTVGASTTIGPTLTAGPYTLVASSCSGSLLTGPNAADYSVVYTSAANDFTVAPAPLAVAVSGSQSYGGTPSFAGSDSPPSGVSVNTSGLTCSKVGTSTIIAPSLLAGTDTLVASSCGGAIPSDGADYVIDYASAPGDFTVVPAPLTITASNVAMTYGGTVPSVVAGYSGFVNGEGPANLTTKPTCSTTATRSSPASPPTYPSSCTGAVDPNYVIGYVAGSVTVNPAPLTITAASPSMTYGGTVPTISPLYTGFVNSDSGSSLTPPPTCTTTVTSSSPASPPTYPSSCSGAYDPNYSITYAGGAVAVNPAPLTISASSGSTVYGGSVPGIIPNYSGFVNGDSASSLTTLPACSTTATSSSPASPPTYPSSCSGAGDPNYAISYAAGTVTVTKAPLSIRASDGAMTYGGTVPTITPALTGFVNGDGPASLAHAPSCLTTATGSSSASPPTYPSSCSAAADPNYAISYVAGAVTVNKAPLTVTASSPAVAYGSVPAVAPIYTGFVGGDTSSSLATAPSCTTTATSSSPVSPPTYPSSCSGAAAANYAIGYVPGTVTVTPAPITVAVSGSQSNEGVPTFEVTATPPPGVSVVGTLTCGQVDPSTTINNQLPSGTYTLAATSCGGMTPGGADAADYTVTYASNSGDFTVTGGPSASTTTTSPPTPPPPAPTHGYWLVGSDGGIFTFGSASFYGSTGSLTLQRPVVGITPTRDRAGYWLVASDGGTFAFGDAGFYGSIPGLGLHPAGSGLPHSLNAPIVGMVPAADGQGYFVVASDGGVFAFGPGASFAGSCPGIGGCSGPAVSVIPDATGNGYWLFTATGNVYTFGDAPFLGSPGSVGSPVTSAVRTPDGKGYWVLVANGTVYAYGDAANDGGPAGQFGGFDPATAVFATADGSGYWVVVAVGAVDPYGDAPNDGGMGGTRLNGAIIAATGF